MNKLNYPNWLVPLDIAIKLKEIGFKENCYFEFSYDNGLTLEANKRDENTIIEIDDLLFCANEVWQNISIPTWEQVFEWFREKGFDSYIGLENLPYPNEGIYYYFEISKPNLYRINQLDWQGEFDDYNEAREALVKSLIQTYKNKQL